jgi:eukaryotic-like serine/threonine-protein kinase
MKPGYLLRNRYSIQRPLAAGFFCLTYLATDCEYYRPKYVVVKHLKPQDKNIDLIQNARRLFETEAIALKKLGDLTDRIPTLYDYFEERREFYLVQEFIAGQTLSYELSKGKLSTLETLQILREILIGLKFVHGENTIHRDLKPDNIIRRADDRSLVLIDFGAVKEVSKTTLTNPNPKTLASIGFGTEGYMPSEQAMGFPKLASDIYAVGAIGIECLTGNEPHLLFDEELLEFKWQHLPQVSNAQLDPLISPLATVLNKMLQQRHLDRYANATEALAAIEEIEKRFNRELASSRKSSSVLQNASFKPMSRTAFLKLISLGGLITASSLLVSQFSQTVESQLAPKQKTKLGSIDKPITIEFTSIKLNTQGDIIDRPNSQAQIFQEALGNGIFLTMVKIPSGRFMMGSPPHEQNQEIYEQPYHPVDIPAFELGQTQVTQAQWAAIFPDKATPANRNSQLPVSNISWFDAIDFCERLSRKTGHQYRLPSESEWEYACRARTTTPFAYGDTISSTLVNYNAEYPYGSAPKGFDADAQTLRQHEKATPVATFPPNLFGLYDMHGNLWEWCLDEWFADYHGAPSDGSARGYIHAKNDGNQTETLRVVRGGSWFSYGRTCRAASRSSLFAGFRHQHYGLRVVCTGV